VTRTTEPITATWLRTDPHGNTEERLFELEVPGHERSPWRVAGLLTIGTGDACDVRLDDARVSRMHCELRATPGGVAVRDLQSKKDRKSTRLNSSHNPASRMPSSA
jgi:pSer/pThr/pTyr-binding forkhead associated (FHA) protein